MACLTFKKWNTSWDISIRGSPRLPFDNSGPVQAYKDDFNTDINILGQKACVWQKCIYREPETGFPEEELPDLEPDGISPINHQHLMVFSILQGTHPSRFNPDLLHLLTFQNQENDVPAYQRFNRQRTCRYERYQSRNYSTVTHSHQWLHMHAGEVEWMWSIIQCIDYIFLISWFWTEVRKSMNCFNEFWFHVCHLRDIIGPLANRFVALHTCISFRARQSVPFELKFEAYALLSYNL